MSISSNEITTGVIALFGVAQGINLWLTKRIKQETAVVNNAVNHVDPGQPTLTQRVDVITKDIEMIKAVALVNKNEVQKRFDEADEKHDALRGMVADIKDAQVLMADTLSRVRESVDRRKPDGKENII